ncbi:response regulator [uncultured Maribacter sp.]|uniref:response regulator n=1 Tax=uncultured Maribacter sp. TaxID=431308 RepID=UPI0030DBB274|tara:strand:+ start:1210 stop:1629 length:420 start_codon:yes stop_codon:yes gene_type:complete
MDAQTKIKLLIMFKILIIEDDEITNFITKTNLEKYGYKNIAIALNGKDGLDYLMKNECPDLILLDINMPVLDGWDFLEDITDRKCCPNVPIILTTSSGRPEDKLKAAIFENVIEYMEKPLNFEILNTIIKKVRANEFEF